MHASSSASPGAAPQSPVTMSAASAAVAPPAGGAASASRPSSPPIDAPPGVLQAKEDMYGGVIVQAEQLTELGAEGFTAALDASLEWWEGLGKRGVWLKVPLAAAALVPLAAAKGFIFHHAEPEYVMMTRWLPSTPSSLPANASHQVGVGAFVMNEAGQVLVVQEASGPLRGKGVWKMPTGLVGAGEDLTLAAEREVLEETGVVAAVESVLAIRQAHGFAFGKSDLFVVVGLRAAAGQTEVKHQESELVAARWMPLSEYCAQPFFQGMQLYTHILDRCVAWAEGRYSGLRADKLESSVTSRRMDLLMWGEDGHGHGHGGSGLKEGVGADAGAAGPRL